MSAVSAPLPAILGGTKAVTLPLPSWPVVTPEDAEQVAEAVRSGNWSWLGPNERAFCEEYAAFLGAKHCLCLANGTVTMQCALQALGVGPGAEVIVPGLTWVATAQAAMDIGANVVFADIDPVSLCLDPDAFAAAITPRTKAVIPVHLFGCMCDMDRIMEIAAHHGIKVLEDVAHQHGSRWRGQAAGTIGHAGSFSFQQSKVLTCGEGGAVVCHDTAVYATVFALKQVGWAPADPGNAPFDRLVKANRYGHNYRLTEMQAVLLRCGLRRLSGQTAWRERSAARLRDGLAALGGPLQVAPRDPRVDTQAYYALTLTFDPHLADGLTRDQYLAALQQEGAGFGGTYEPVYRNGLLNLYDPQTSPIPHRGTLPQDYAALRLPNTEKAVTRTAVVLSQRYLLGSDAFLDEVLAAVAKINAHLGDVRRHLAAKPA